MMRYTYMVRDRKTGEIMFTDSLEAPNRTAARKRILDVARRDVPGGRGRSARLYGYVPVSDYRIIFTKEELVY